MCEDKASPGVPPDKIDTGIDLSWKYLQVKGERIFLEQTEILHPHCVDQRIVGWSIIQPAVNCLTQASHIGRLAVRLQHLREVVRLDISVGYNGLGKSTGVRRVRNAL